MIFVNAETNPVVKQTYNTVQTNKKFNVSFDQNSKVKITLIQLIPAEEEWLAFGQFSVDWETGNVATRIL